MAKLAAARMPCNCIRRCWRHTGSRQHQRRTGRILFAPGQDAADLGASTTFGPSVLKSLKVWSNEVPAAAT